VRAKVFVEICDKEDPFESGMPMGAGFSFAVATSSFVLGVEFGEFEIGLAAASGDMIFAFISIDTFEEELAALEFSFAYIGFGMVV
jgi:hypothetical protein